jgi:hypothetical protein
MKKLVLIFALFFGISSAFVSCRDQKNATEMDNDTEMNDGVDNVDDEGDIEQAAEDVGEAIDNAAEDTGQAIDEAAEDTGEAVEEGWDEAKENTGVGGNDDM